MSIWNALQKKLLEELNNQNLSQAELARRIGWKQQHVNRYFSGPTEPGLEKLAELAGGLGLTLEDLVRGVPLVQPKGESKPSVAEQVRLAVREEILKLRATQVTLGAVPETDAFMDKIRHLSPDQRAAL